ncbi:hypothetical protein T484DRAFT_1746538 [Baffinella frigidus]|nr:hypothetical protein T484DRAFT_1746538 [Cryptophyta sp. CCMP2293]
MSKKEDATKVADKVRKKTHLPRDSQGFIRVQWLENFYETLYASNERDIHIPFTVVFQVVSRRRPPGRVGGEGDGAGETRGGGVVTGGRSQYRRIYAAYYTDNEGYVQKVDKIAELGPDQVMEGLKDLSPGGAKSAHPKPQPIEGCRAYYIYAKKHEDAFPTADTGPDLSVEFFDDSSLSHFLTYRGKENNGILQQFQEFSTPAVSTVRAYWTPHYCSLETRINPCVATFASNPCARPTTREWLMGAFAGWVQGLIDRMVTYMSACLPNNVKIQLMILNFRIGASGKVSYRPRLLCLPLTPISVPRQAFGSLPTEIYGRKSGHPSQFASCVSS